MATEERIQSDLAIPPGEYLEEVIQELGMTKEELARRMQRPATKLSPIFKGKKRITPETALQLEQVVGVPAHIWLGLETEYRITLAKHQNDISNSELDAEGHLVKGFQYSTLVKHGFVERSNRVIDKVRDLRRFFGVMSLLDVTETDRYKAAFRYGKSTASERTPEAVATWLRIGEIKALKLNCAPFAPDKLRKALGEIRAMTTERNFKDTRIKLEEKMSELGVALVICTHLPKTKAHGAVFWMGRDKAVLMLSLRFKWADIFWFSFFHEIGHILQHGRNTVILEDYVKNEMEDEADKFAADLLIPPNEYSGLAKESKLDERSVRNFARRIGIDPGIVVGRLQHDRKIENWMLNELRTLYDMS